MAESINSSELHNVSEATYQSATRKRFEKFRAKLVELFFNSNNNTPAASNSMLITPVLSSDDATTTVQHSQQKRRKSSSTSTNASTSNQSHNLDLTSSNSLSNSTLISNCYYGYKTIDDKEPTSRPNSHKKSKKASSTSSSASEIDSIKTNSPGSNLGEGQKQQQQQRRRRQKSSKEAEENSSLPLPPSGTIMIDSISTNYDSFSLSTNNTFDFYQLNTNETAAATENLNPFFNPSLTKLISFNSDLSLVESYFEASLHLIDDQDNFFDIDFMTNYISYILFKRIKNSSLLGELAYDLKVHEQQQQQEPVDSTDLLAKISRDIFLQSETEPCGLKGCKMSIYLEESEHSNHLLSQFRFDTTSSLTTFELELILKINYSNTGLNANAAAANAASKVSNSPFATLTRRLLNRTQNNKNNVTKSQDPSETNKCVLLDSNNYVL
jgi:hypothetical protein